MKKLHTAFTTWNSASPTEIESFFIYLKAHKNFTPEKLGSFEPLKLDFGRIDLQGFQKILSEEKWLLTNRRKPPRQSFNISNVARPKKPNHFLHSLLASQLGKQLNPQDYLRFITDLFLIFKFEHGSVCHDDDWDTKNMQIDAHGMKALGVDLAKHLPGIYWANFFGRRYVEFFGRSKILKAPAYKIEELENGGILLLTTESPFDFQKDEVKLREKEIIRFLGEDAFFSKDDPPNKKYRAPDFQITT